MRWGRVDVVCRELHVRNSHRDCDTGVVHPDVRGLKAPMRSTPLAGTVAVWILLMGTTSGTSRGIANDECPPCGDINCDGVVDAIDALFAAQMSAGLRTEPPCVAAVDANDDGAIDIADALQIGQLTVGLRTSLICPPVLEALTPPTVDAIGQKTVRVTGRNFAPGAAVSVDDETVPTTYVSCDALDIQLSRRRPGTSTIRVVNPDLRSSHEPKLLYIAGLFRDVTGRAGITFTPQRGIDLLPVAGGVVVFDYDGDARDDIFVPSNGGANGLLRAGADGTFVDVAAAAGVSAPGGRSNGACAADYDNDGDVDLYVTNTGPNRLFRNNGNGTFSDVTIAAGVDDHNRSTGCSWGDYDRDGFVDLYVANHLDESDPSVFVTRRFGPARRSDRLFHNARDGRFDDVTALLGPANLVTGAGFGASFIDYDNDGDADLYLVNDFGREIQPNVLWRNDGPLGSGWRFTDVSAASRANIGIFGMGLAIGDYDTDGFFDFYTSNIGRSTLLRARGDGTYEDRTDAAHVGRESLGQTLSIGWGDAFLDYDNDGALDLYLVAGYLDSDPLINIEKQPNALFRNRGNGTFEDVSDISGADNDGIGRGLAVADFNRDGFLDLVVVNLGQGLLLLENTARTPGHWLELDLIGTRSNRDGIGARITATMGARRQIREVVAGGSSISQSSSDVHFGLGAFTSVERIDIRWPSGRVQSFHDVAADQRLVVTEP